MPKYISTRRLVSYWRLYLFVLPSALMVGVFSYFPAASAIYHAFFRWNGSYVKEFVGLYNFHQLLGWSPFLWLVMVSWIVLLMAILVGRPLWLVRGAPWGVVALVGVLGLALFAAADNSTVLNMNASEAWDWYGRALWGTVIGVGVHKIFRREWSQWVQGLCLLYSFLWFFYQSMMTTGDQILWSGFGVIFILVLANLVKMVPSIVTAVFIHRLKSERWQYIYRVLFVVPMIVPAMVGLLVWKSFYDPTQGILNRILNGSGFMEVLVWMDGVFSWGVFHAGANPSWLGDASLVIPALVFWGFPWVGTVGVLIYLTGLASIDESVYEAADLDNASALQKFFYIEFPLILTQVRINLVLMIIGTLQTYGQILILLGDTGGPRGVALVPGLYMFRSAFVELYAGKACAIGLIVFFFILILTEINNRFVRVEK
ncbi:MAG: ABC-type sugar transport system permease subunit [Candidatus Latescibacterota bacterium]|jgi:ABC-type sugar transport system permease subunit